MQSRREADLRAGYAHLNGGAAASFEDLVGADSQSGLNDGRSFIAP